jgi:hypothetical protein
MQPERRRNLRFPFDAQAEVSRERTDARLPARVTEIGPGGCYLQMGQPLEVGTSLFVRIFVEDSFFETHAMVVYSQTNAGMGVAFRELKPYFVEVLKKWLLQAMLATQKPRD